MASHGVAWQYSAVFARMGRRRASNDLRLSQLGKAALLWRVWVTAAQAQIALWRRPLPEVVASLRTQATDARRPTALLSLAVSRGLRIGPWQPRCLLRSLVLYRLLRAQGDAADLVIGLPDRPTTSDAHAWVELAGRDVGPLPGGAGYQELTRYPRELGHALERAP